VGETISLLHVGVKGLDENARLLSFVRPVMFRDAENVTQRFAN